MTELLYMIEEGRHYDLPTEEEQERLLVTLQRIAPSLTVSVAEFEVAGYIAMFFPMSKDYFSGSEFILASTANVIFVRQYEEALKLFNTSKKRVDFLQNVPAEDIAAMRSYNLMDDRQFEELKEQKELNMFQFLKPFNVQKLLQYCKIKLMNGTYRTKAQAEDTFKNMPNTIAVPTIPNYQYLMSLNPTGNAYLQPLSSTDGLKFSDGKMYFIGNDIQPVSEVELQDLITSDSVNQVDLGLLRIFYSIILTRFEGSNHTEVEDITTLYVPDLAECMGLQRNINKNGIQRIIDIVKSFHNIVGVMHGTRNGKPSQSLFPVLNFEGYDDKHNTISFSSPYMNMVIKTVYKLSIRKKPNGEVKTNKKGEPTRIASHSYLIKSSIASERNKAAVENVVLIVQLIEQCGNRTPHIAAKTLIKRNPLLEQRLNQKNKTTVLKRTFEATWRILREQTTLESRYSNIQLPDPKDPSVIPSVKNLESMVFQFPHEGKRPEAG
ncbi:MAG: hypothetical protein MJ071_07875 [Oscillospiraceae bacterium]|nr:hypothetical protein [Oscillospiraceae bacterium]